VSSAERFVRHHRRQTDRAISQAYARLATDGMATATFAELLHSARNRARRLLDAPVVNGRHPGVEALVNLSRFKWAHMRPVADWPGTSASWRPAVCSLARHLTCKYAVPAFLAASWYATDDAYAEKKREWFVAHARGASFRSLDVPIEMTRKMEDVFLKSRDHLAVEHAMRRAELLILGASDELVRAVLATRSGTDLGNAAFWRTVWTFLIANAGAIDHAQIGPMIDFVQAIRHERVAVQTPDGIVMRDPPQPSFSMKGRTMQSMLRLMQDWHRSLGVANGGLAWAPSPLQPMMIEEASQDPSAPPSVWQMLELTNGSQLRAEGTALRHCVASYADRCWRGASRIWSLRVHRGEKVRHVLTVEVDMKRRAVVQARGWGNRAPSGKPLRVLQDWAVRERVRLAIQAGG
jgi:PcfJ-like protein